MNEDIERHEKSGQKNCNDARSYRTAESAMRADGSTLRIEEEPAQFIAPPFHNNGYMAGAPIDIELEGDRDDATET